MVSMMKIGDFARLARVTVKTLRHYADEGLLPPSHIDRRTSYRYYEPRQLRDLNHILNLREAGLGIVEIKSVIADGGVPAALLAARRESLERERLLIERRIRLVDALAHAAGAGGVLSEVRLSVIEPQRAHTVRANVVTLGAQVTNLFERAEAEVAAFSARLLTNPFLLFHDPAPKAADVDLEVCIPASVAEGLETRIVPGDELSCSITYGGDYAKSDAVRARLDEWLTAAGLAAVGPTREIYHRFSADLEGYSLPKDMLAARSADFITEVQVAIAPVNDKEREQT